MKKRTVLLASLAACVLFTGGAAADQRTVSDPNDNGSFLDIASVSHDHGQRPDGSWRFHHTITTFERWKSRELCGSSIGLRIKDTDRYLTIFWRKGLRARLFHNDRLIGHPAVWRSDRRSVDVSIRPRLLGTVDGDYLYNVKSATGPCTCDDTSRSGHPGERMGVERPAACVGLLDRAPDKGYVRHEL